MNPTEAERHCGKLVKWDDSRGFGFVEPSDGGKNIFVHIKDIRPGERRPTIGDTVYYEIGVGNQEKPKAINAFIAGVRPLQRASSSPSITHSPRLPRRSLRRREVRAYFMAFMLISLCAVYPISCAGRFVANLVYGGGNASPVPTDYYRPVPEEQRLIKGNISYTNGDRYYHTPGMRDYDITEINESRGERWFRTEAEARAAGWRRAPGE